MSETTKLSGVEKHHLRGSTCPQGSSRTRSERLNLIHQVFERCRLLGLQAPLLSDLDDFLDGRTSVMPPVVDSSNID